MTSQLVLPTGCLTVNAQFLTKSGGSGTAAHWRSWIETYVPLLYPSIWAANGAESRRSRAPNELGHNTRLTEQELRLVLLLAEWSSLVMRPSISETMLAKAEELIVEWQKQAFKLHPMLRGLPNMHFIRHIGQDIRSFGPVYGFWNFAPERINKLLGNMNSNNHSGLETSLLRRFLDLGMVEPLLGRLEGQAANDAQVDAAQALKQVYGKVAADDPVISVFRTAPEDLAAETLCRDQLRLAKGKPGQIQVDILFYMKTAISKYFDSASFRHDEPGREAQPPASFVLHPNVTNHARFVYGRKVFKSLEHPSLLAKQQTACLKDCLFEFREDSEVFNCVLGRRKTFLIDRIFTHIRHTKDATRTESTTWLAVRPLKEAHLETIDSRPV